MLADPPWGMYAVTIRWSIRRLFCDDAHCERRIVAERLPGITAPRARKATRLAGRLTAVGLALGGAAGMRLSQKLGPAASRQSPEFFMSRRGNHAAKPKPALQTAVAYAPCNAA